MMINDFFRFVMTLQELTNQYDNHPEQQEEIRNDVLEW